MLVLGGGVIVLIFWEVSTPALKKSPVPSKSLKQKETFNKSFNWNDICPKNPDPLKNRLFSPKLLVRVLGDS